ncbi:MAG: hypothetical protein ACFFEU_01220 [Candidatus Thorarchaeota archaeon]
MDALNRYNESSFSNKFLQLATELKETCENNKSHEANAVLFRTSWVELILTYDHHEQNPLRVEVELVAFDQNSRHDQQEKLPLTMISHLQYLLDLIRVGFEVHIIDECCWLASMSFPNVPDQNVVKALIPPKIER